jgi:cyanophycin synthetase
MYNSYCKYLVDFSSSYFIALEAWRRGLGVTFIKNTNNYRISSKKKSLFFCNSAMIAGVNGLVPFSICKSKTQTKLFLNKCYVKTPEGHLFSVNKTRDIIKYASSIGYPVVIKPNNEGGGKDVYPGINNKSELFITIEYFKSNLYKEVLIEKHYFGDEYRVYVVNKKVVDVYKRTCATITGDGNQSIKQLINLKNEIRHKNPHLSTRPIIIDQEVIRHIHNRNYDLNSILPDGKSLILRSKANLSAGGDLEDVTETIDLELTDAAVKAISSIPYMVNGGVDVIYNNKTKEAIVLEINSMGQLGGHLFSNIQKNKERIIPEYIIDYYFPESIKMKHRFYDIYYNQTHAINYLNNDHSKDYTLAQIPFNNYVKIKVSYFWSSINDNAVNNIRDVSRRMQVVGSLHINHKSKNVEIILCGNKKDIEYVIQSISDSIMPNAREVNIIDYNREIVSEFSVINTFNGFNR